MGVTVYSNWFKFDQLRENSLFDTQSNLFYTALSDDASLHYTQRSAGIAIYLSYARNRSHFSLTYGFDQSKITPQNSATSDYFGYVDFEGTGSYQPNDLAHIHTSYLTPAFHFDSRNDSLQPTAGAPIFAANQVAGGVLGGDVNFVRPVLDIQYYHPAPGWRRNTIAAHLKASFVAGYGGTVAPVTARSDLGGEQDVRGFDTFSLSPIAFIDDVTTIPVYNSSGTPRTQRVLIDDTPTLVPVTQTIPMFRLLSPGGDTAAVANLEYRIPFLTEFP